MKSVLKERSSKPAQPVQRKSAGAAAPDSMAERINNSPMMVAQRERMNSLFGRAIQCVEDEEPLQGKFEATLSVQLKDEIIKSNDTGLPNNLKSGIESLSGISMDNVRVHYNSSQPAQLNAHAYTQGTDIHVASGQEKHLPHEAWHVVQQAQGRVQPTMQMKEGVAINNDKGLEREADMMGQRALMGGVGGEGVRKGEETKSPLQLFPIGINEELETTEPTHRDRIIYYLNHVQTDKLQEILFRLMLIQPRHDNHVEYIQICKYELGKREALAGIAEQIKAKKEEIENDRKLKEAIGMKTDHEEKVGVWTSATVFHEHDRLFTTPPQQSGTGARDTYGYDRHGETTHEHTVSTNDSEVATLTLLAEELNQHWRRFGRGDRVKILITGNIGPCDGCKDRLNNFWNHIGAEMERAWINLSMEVHYMTGSCSVSRGETDTTYGYGGDGRHTYWGEGEISYYYHVIADAPPRRKDDADSPMGEAYDKDRSSRKDDRHDKRSRRRRYDSSRRSRKYGRYNKRLSRGRYNSSRRSYGSDRIDFGLNEENKRYREEDGYKKRVSRKKRRKNH